MEYVAKIALLSATILAATYLKAPAATAEGHASKAEATLNNLDGDPIGNATLTQTPHGVLVHVQVRDLPPGAKGIHLHAKADCAADTGFKSSMGHHGEGEGDHGLLNPRGPGKGDLGNIYVSESDTGELQFFKTGAFLDSGDLPLLDADGTAIVIHANEDDQVSQPIGGADTRIVCGVVSVS